MSDSFAQKVERRAYQQRLDVFVSSREAGLQLTADGLRDGVSLTRLIDTAADLARYTDDAIAIVRDEYRPRLDCKEGCSYCCQKPGVLVTPAELLRIIKHVSALDEADLASVAQRARAYVEQLAGRSFDAPTSESFPCPLLRDNRCSVYDIRPLTCRGYNSTSVEACKGAHASPEVMVPLFALIKDVADGATIGTATALRAIGVNDALVDLGTALAIALEHGAGFADAVASGGDALRPAENATWVDALWHQVQDTARQIGIELK